jgi:hypothetical protein
MVLQSSIKFIFLPCAMLLRTSVCDAPFHHRVHLNADAAAAAGVSPLLLACRATQWGGRLPPRALLHSTPASQVAGSTQVLYAAAAFLY